MKLILLSIILFMAGIFTLLLSYHNLDLAFNMKELNIEYDINPFGIIKNNAVMHLQGLQGIIISFFCFFTSITFLLYLKV